MTTLHNVLSQEPRLHLVSWTYSCRQSQLGCDSKVRALQLQKRSNEAPPRLAGRYGGRNDYSE
jgi:hypothetical protein